MGRASFSQTLEDGRRLAKSLVSSRIDKLPEENRNPRLDSQVSAATDQGIKTAAALTAMDTPLGMAVGNSLEVIEAIETLRGNGPADLIELVVAEGGLVLQLAGRVDSLEQGKEQISATLQNGTALDTFEKMLVSQNVAADVAHELCRGDVLKVLPTAKYVTPLVAPSTGTLLGFHVKTIIH